MVHDIRNNYTNDKYNFDNSREPIHLYTKLTIYVNSPSLLSFNHWLFVWYKTD